MTKHQQNPVSAVTWPWQQRRESPTKPVWPHAIRQALLMLCIAAVFQFGFKHHLLPRVLAVLAVCVLFSGRFYPPFFLALERFAKWFGVVVGRTFTWVLLVPFFYLCFVPGRLLLVLRGKDPLNLRCPTDLATYWDVCKRRDASHAERQF